MAKQSAGAPSLRDSRSLKLWLLIAAVMAVLAGLLEVEAGQGRPTFAMVGSGQIRAHLPDRIALEPGKASSPQLAEEYRAIRPADTDGVAPFIPAAETWPAP